MFMHGSWGHILGNMMFLAVFGKNVEDAFGRLRYLVYFAGGFAATMTQTLMTLSFSSAADGRVPNLGASGAIAAVLGVGLFGVFPIRISAWFFLGFWFLYQLFEADFGLFGAAANGGGVAFFAHVGGFLFGVVVTVFLSGVGRLAPQGGGQALRAPA
jgi:hypothetical protein